LLCLLFCYSVVTVAGCRVEEVAHLRSELGAFDLKFFEEVTSVVMYLPSLLIAAPPPSTLNTGDLCGALWLLVVAAHTHTYIRGGGTGGGAEDETC
jgi:hypothetical protein